MSTASEPLIPAERLALTVARAQLERGDNPPVNITTVLVMTIDRLLGGEVRAIKLSEPRPYAFTRDQLIDALARIELRPVDGKIVAEWMADAILVQLGPCEDCGRMPGQPCGAPPGERCIEEK